MAAEACAAAKAEGNTAYGSGDLEKAASCYTHAIEEFDQALAALPTPKSFSTGDCVRYSKGFGRVESAFPIMDEYFLKDLGTDQAIWVGDAGGDLRRFSKSELQLVTQELFDLRLACAQNLAAVKLKQEDFELAIQWADVALRMAGKSPKALMRKGAALLKSGRPGPASEVLMLAVQFSPKDPEAKKLLREAEKSRDPTWVCANGCCGPWGLQNHMAAQPKTLPTPLNPSGTGSTLGAMKFGPTTAGNKIVADDDSDSDCSTCDSNDGDQDCSKKEKQDSPKTTEQSSPREGQFSDDKQDLDNTENKPDIRSYFGLNEFKEKTRKKSKPDMAKVSCEERMPDLDVDTASAVESATVSHNAPSRSAASYDEQNNSGMHISAPGENLLHGDAPEVVPPQESYSASPRSAAVKSTVPLDVSANSTLISRHCYALLMAVPVLFVAVGFAWQLNTA